MSLEMCRGCLAAGAGLALLSLQHGNYRQHFMDLAGVIVNEGDGMPQSICRECAKRFAQFSEFREKVLRSQEFLLEVLQQTTCASSPVSPDAALPIKEEPEEPPEAPERGASPERAGDKTGRREREKRRKKKDKSKSKSKKCKPGSRTPRVLIEVDPAKILTVRLSAEEQRRRHALAAADPAYLAMPHRCTACHKGFNYERKLLAHQQNYHKENAAYRCEICQRTLVNAASLALHAARHDTQYECRVCLQRFVEKKRAISHHQSEHEGVERRVLCKHCGQSFRHRSTLNGHMRSHHPRDERPACDVCGKTFVSKDSLLDHLLIHSGEKNYGCGTCGKRFRMKSEVAAHARSHSAARPYHCAPCDKLFKTRASYGNHRRLARAHVAPETLQRHRCAQCSRGFASAWALRAHAGAHGGARHECARCGAALSSRAALNKHVRAAHLRIPPPKNHVCHACGKRFAGGLMLENHIRVHTGERPFVCALAGCGARFAQKSTLHSHVRLTHLKLKRAVGGPAPAPLCGGSE